MIVSAALLLMTVPTVPTAEPARRARPLRPLAQLISSSDYPVDAIIRKAEGRTRFELAIDGEGTPYSCRILESAKEPSLDRVTCDLFMTRAKFQPAADARGQPVPDIYSNVVEWRLPEEASDVMAFEPTRVVVTAYSTAAGVSHCDMREGDYDWPRFTRDQCLEIVGREIIDLAEYWKMPATMTLVNSFTPHGQKEAEDEQAHGLLGIEATAAVRIGPDGNVTYCQTLDIQVNMNLLQPPSPDLCDSFGLRDAKFPPVNNPAEARSGRWSVRFYVGENLPAEKPRQGAR